MIPFIPTIYEHAAALVSKKPSEAACDEDLLVAAQLAAYELYRHDLVSVGLDIYNIEAEALGAVVNYPDDYSLPSLQGTLINDEADLDRLSVPDPETAGRMPLLLNACERIRQKVPVIVSGTVVGPFTLAAILRGFENFIVDLVTEPDFARKQLDFAKEVGLEFAKAYRKRGVSLAINESWIAPPLCSPDIYREFAWPVENKMIRELKAMGFPGIALICGGDTGSIVKDMLRTGTSLIMADWHCDRLLFKELCRPAKVKLRASIEAKVVETGDLQEMRQCAARVINDCLDYPHFVFGCGIVSYDTASVNVLNLKNIVRELTDKF